MTPPPLRRTLPPPLSRTALFAWLDAELRAGRLTPTQYDLLWAYAEAAGDPVPPPGHVSS